MSKLTDDQAALKHLHNYYICCKLSNSNRKELVSNLLVGQPRAHKLVIYALYGDAANISVCLKC